MSRLRGSHLRSLRLVFSTVPFCQGEDGSQNHVCVPISACRWGQLTNSVPRSKVMDLRAERGKSRIASMIFPITGFVRLFGFFGITVNRLTRSTSEVTFLFEQHKVIRQGLTRPHWGHGPRSFPVAKLTSVRDIVGAEQDTDITVELGLSASSGAPRPPGDTVGW